jgi:outer membrane receptor protein involved in Fe transport
MLPDLSRINGATSGITGPFKNTLIDTILRTSGRLFRAPGGDVTLSAYVEQRREKVDDTITPGTSGFVWLPAKSQKVDSAYLEFRAPLIGPANRIPLIKGLELFGSVRHDEYRTETAGGFGIGVPDRDGPFPEITPIINRVRSTDFTFGVRYNPITNLTLRASYGTGFLPPSMGQLQTNRLNIPANSAPFLIINDPKRGGTRAPRVPFVLLNGGNPDLNPEGSKSLSVGVIYQPGWLPHARLSLDFTRIQKTGEIFAPQLAYILAHEDQFPGRIIRGANLPNDPMGWAGPITQIDQTSLNISTSTIKAYDLQFDYDIDLGRFGNFRPFVVATRQTSLKRQVLPDQTPFQFVGHSDGPLEWRANFGVRWQTKSGWGAGWQASLFDGYSVCAAATQASCPSAIVRQGSERFPSQMYHDLYVSYQFSEPHGPFAGVEMRLVVLNATDRSPPIVAQINQPGYSFYGDPRMRRFLFTVSKRF